MDAAHHDRQLARRELLLALDAVDRPEEPPTLDVCEMLGGGLLEYFAAEAALAVRERADHRARLARFFRDQSETPRGQADGALVRGYLLGFAVARLYLLEQPEADFARQVDRVLGDAFSEALAFAGEAAS